MDNHKCKCKPKGHEVTLVMQVINELRSVYIIMEKTTFLPIVPFVGMGVSGTGTDTRVRYVGLDIMTKKIRCTLDTFYTDRDKLLIEELESKGWRQQTND